MSKLKINRILTARVADPNEDPMHKDHDFHKDHNKALDKDPNKDPNQDPYAGIQFKSVKSSIKNLDGSVALASDALVVPMHWSDIAVDVLARNYLRRKGVPLHLKKVHEAGIPQWLSRSVTDDSKSMTADELNGRETDARQVFDRLAGAWTYWGVKGDYFDTEQDARNFFDEMRYMLAMQMAAPNSPQWFNTGLYWAYGINGASQGHYYFDEALKRLEKSQSAYERPQPHACFIQSVKDDLVNEGGIMDLWTSEARLFKYGSGTGTNFSNLRGSGERLAGGGFSSGLMSFLRIGDVAGGSIKSGGTTRRAAKMVIVDIDHPDIEAFINWKNEEGNKVIDLVVGSRILKKHVTALKESYKNSVSLKKAIAAAREDEIPDGYILRVLDILRYGHDFEKDAYTLDWDSDAYRSVFGQNSNNSVRVNDAFMHAVENDGNFDLKWRTDGSVCKTVKAQYLWDCIAKAAWGCADPGVQYDTTINAWNTCSNDDRINGSNPCSEYMFLDDTACNLASLNLCMFARPVIGQPGASNRMDFDIETFKHATRLWTIALEISVYMAQFPTKAIAERSYQYRTLGLGYGNLGAFLMQSGIAYDSDEARSIAGGFTALMHGVAYETSAEMAKCMGAFERYEANKECMMRVMKNHFIAAYGGQEVLQSRIGNNTNGTVSLISSAVPSDGYYAHTVSAKMENDYAEKNYSIGFGAQVKRNYVDDYVANFAKYEGLNVLPVPFDRTKCRIAGLADAVEQTWDSVLENGEKYGFRNAQVTVLAPTGTIGMVMDFKTTGIEPLFSHVAIKQLAGGGVWRLVNEDISKAFAMLDYSAEQIEAISNYVVGHGHLNGSIALNTQWLYSKGFMQADVAMVEESLKKSFSIHQAFARYALDEQLFVRLGISETQLSDPAFSLLKHLGATDEEIAQADKFACGHMTVEGAPGLKPEHVYIFDCASVTGDGSRCLSWQSHVKMMAAAQPFLSGAISKTINMPANATIKDCEDAYMLSWKLALKAVALYRDGSKYSQVLNTRQSLTNVLDSINDNTAEKTGQIHDARAEISESISQKAKEDEADSVDSVDAVEEMRSEELFKPFRRRGYTQHVMIGGSSGLSSLWHTTGEDENGKLRNLLLTYGKEGSTLRGWASAWGRILSMYLQDKGDSALIRVYKGFRHSKFEPMGEVQGHPYIKHATSIPDYIVEDLVVAYPEMLNAPLSASTLPPQRNGKINKVRIGQETMYIIIGEDTHSRPAEIFVSGIGNEGSDLRGWMNSCAKLISLYFQDCGETAIWQFINAFEGSSFEPAGFVEGHGVIKFATSPLDFLAKHLRMTYSHVLSTEQTVLPLTHPIAVPVVPQEGTGQCAVKKDDEIKIRALSGYKVDEPCRSCRAFKLRYNGTCYVCDNCFVTTGCS